MTEKPLLGGKEVGRRQLLKSPWSVSFSPDVTFPSSHSSHSGLCWVDVGNGEAGKMTRGWWVRQPWFLSGHL